MPAEPVPVTVIIRDQDGQEWRFTELSSEDGPHVLTIDGPDGNLPELEAPSKDELYRRLRNVLKERPDLLALLP